MEIAEEEADKAETVEDEKAEEQAEEESTAEENAAKEDYAMKAAEVTASQAEQEKALEEAAAMRVNAEKVKASKETSELKTAGEEATAEESAAKETAAKEEEAAAKEAAAKKVDEESYARGESTKKAVPEKPAPRTSFLWSVLLFPIHLVVPLLHHNMSQGHCPAASTSSTSPSPWICSSAHSPMPIYLYKAPPYTTSSLRDSRKMFGHSSCSNMMSPKYEDHVWPKLTVPLLSTQHPARQV